MQNQNWPAIVYRLKLSGTFVYLPENNMLGFIHPSERYAEPRLGQVLDARVIGFREVDRTLNLSLKPRSFEMLENDAQMILTYLESNGGFMTLMINLHQTISRPLLVFPKASLKKPWAVS